MIDNIIKDNNRRILTKAKDQQARKIHITLVMKEYLPKEGSKSIRIRKRRKDMEESKY